MYCSHIKTNDPYDETQGQAQLWLINHGSYKLYRFRIHTIYRTVHT